MNLFSLAGYRAAKCAPGLGNASHGEWLKTIGGRKETGGFPSTAGLTLTVASGAWEQPLKVPDRSRPHSSSLLQRELSTTGLTSMVASGA